MGLKEWRITLDNPDNTYYPGQTINGEVQFTFDSVKTVRGIRIEFNGRANTFWTENETRSKDGGKSEDVKVEYSGEENYFAIQYYLLGSKSGREIQIPAGTHKYPFTCALPPTLPSSFEGEFGHVRYTIKVTLDRPWKFDQETKMAFTVINHFDLNLDNKHKAPMKIHITKKFCCLWCQSAPVKLDVCLPMSGYCPGQTIPLDISCENGSGVNIDLIAIEFKKVCVYRCESPVVREKQSSVILSDVRLGGVEAHSNKNMNEVLKIPPLPPSNLDNCGIIDLVYYIVAHMSPSGMHTAKEESKAITIGTVPIMGEPYQSVPFGNMTANPVGNVDTPFLTSALDVDNNTPHNGHPSKPSAVPYPNMAPPIYQESQFTTSSIQDKGDGPHTMYQGNPQFAPKYPTYGFVLPTN